MLRQIQFILLIALSLPSLACDDINGLYKSYSETHWHFDLLIKGADATLTYSDYSYGVRDSRTDFTKEDKGYCEPKGDDYLLIFAGEEILIKYHKKLSHAAFGQEGSSTGITGKFFPEQEVKLWNFQ